MICSGVGTHIRVEGVHENGVRREDITRALGGGESIRIDEQRTRRHLLHIEHRADLTGVI